MASLDGSLSSSAGKYAQRALEAYVKKAFTDFVVFGGVAVELAVKAKLARANPVSSLLD